MSCCGNTILKMPGDPSEKKNKKKNIKLSKSGLIWTICHQNHGQRNALLIILDFDSCH